MCKDGERHGKSRVSCPSTHHNVPGQGSNAGVECSNHEATARVKLNELRWINSPIRNEKADKQIKMVDLQFVDFPLW